MVLGDGCGFGVTFWGDGISQGHSSRYKFFFYFFFVDMYLLYTFLLNFLIPASLIPQI